MVTERSVLRSPTPNVATEELGVDPDWERGHFGSLGTDGPSRSIAASGTPTDHAATFIWQRTHPASLQAPHIELLRHPPGTFRGDGRLRRGGQMEKNVGAPSGFDGFTKW